LLFGDDVDHLRPDEPGVNRVDADLIAQRGLSW
jgi:hypothetical protein